MGLNSIVDLTISSTGKGVSRKGFGIPMVVGAHSAWAERYKTYDAGTALATMAAEGLTSATQIYKTVQSIVQQSPKVKKVMVGRLTSAYSHLSELTVKTAVEGDVIAFTLRHPDGTSTAISYTVQTADTTTLVAVAISALIDAVTGITSTSAVAIISNVADATNATWSFEGLDITQLWFSDTTVDSSLATEIAEIRTLNSTWYGLTLADAPSSARILAIAAYAETLEILFGQHTYDTDNHDPNSVTSVMYAAEAASYFRTFLIYSGDQKGSAAGAWIGDRFPADPGSSTWNTKTLSGLTVDILDENATGSMDAVGGNYYVEIAGLNVTQKGKVAGGEWIDVVRFRDWEAATIREDIFGLIAAAPKIPYTNKGITLIDGQLIASLGKGVTAGGIDGEQPIVTSFPDVSAIDASYKIDRLLPDGYFEAYLAGAIHATKINGVLLV